MVIPDSVTSIGGNAFRGNENMKSIKYRGSAQQWTAITKGDWWNYGSGLSTLKFTITYNYTGE